MFAAVARGVDTTAPHAKFLYKKKSKMKKDGISRMMKVLVKQGGLLLGKDSN